MLTKQDVKTILYCLYSLVVCPAIGAASAALAGFPDSDAVIFSLFLALPSALALAGRVVVHVGAGWIVAGVLVAPMAGMLTLWAIVGATQGN